MFNVIDKETKKEFTVYGVKSRNGKTSFLIWQSFNKDGRWVWANADFFKPI